MPDEIHPRERTPAREVRPAYLVITATQLATVVVATVADWRALVALPPILGATAILVKVVLGRA